MAIQDDDKVIYSWYSEIILDSDPAKIDLRLTVLSDFIKETGDEYSPFHEFLKIYWLLPSNSDDYRKKLVSFFSSAVPEFPKQLNAFEIRVLAAIGLYKLFREEMNKGNFDTALGFLTAAFGRNKPRPPISELMTHVNHLVLEKAQSRYDNRIVFNTQSYLKKIDAVSDVPTLAAAAKEALIKQGNTLLKMNKFFDEQLNILWWIFSGHSRDLMKRFEELDDRFLPLVIGKEIGDIVHTLPGPISLDEFINYLISKYKTSAQSTISIQGAVNSAPQSWKELTLHNGDFSENQFYFPLHAAILHSKYSTSKTDWLEAFSKNTGLNPKTKFPFTQVAKQIYLERILIKSWRT